jgi:hypothetical protein
MLNQLLDNGWSAELRSSAPDADLQRLGWLALLQNPLLGRGMPVGQVVVYCVAPPAENERAAAARSITWLRWCVALPPGGAGP